MTDTSRETVERLKRELTRAFPDAEHGGSDAALRMGEVGVDASVCMEASAMLDALLARAEAAEAQPTPDLAELQARYALNEHRAARQRAEAERDRLRRIPQHYGAPTDDPDAAIRWITGIMDAENGDLRRERDRLRDALFSIETCSWYPPHGQAAAEQMQEIARAALGEDRA